MLMSIENMQKNVVIFATIGFEVLFKKCMGCASLIVLTIKNFNVKQNAGFCRRRRVCGFYLSIGKSECML